MKENFILQKMCGVYVTERLYRTQACLISALRVVWIRFKFIDFGHHQEVLGEMDTIGSGPYHK